MWVELTVPWLFITLPLRNHLEIFSLGLTGCIILKHISNLHMIRSIMNSILFHKTPIHTQLKQGNND